MFLKQNFGGVLGEKEESQCSGYFRQRVNLNDGKLTIVFVVIISAGRILQGVWLIFFIAFVFVSKFFIVAFAYGLDSRFHGNDGGFFNFALQLLEDLVVIKFVNFLIVLGKS